MKRIEAIGLTLVLAVLGGCGKKGGDGTSVAKAASKCETIAPAGYCIAVPPGMARNDALFVDNILNQEGGGKNSWRTDGKPYAESSQITVTFTPKLDSYDMYRELAEDKKDGFKDAKSQDLSGGGKWYQATKTDGSFVMGDAVFKGSKYVVQCRATTPGKTLDSAVLDACKSLVVN